MMVISFFKLHIINISKSAFRTWREPELDSFKQTIGLLFDHATLISECVFIFI